MPDETANLKSKYRILGVDTSLRSTGYGVIEVDRNQMRVLDCGVIKNRPKVPLSECLRRLNGGMRELMGLFSPDLAAIEGGFFYKNAKTAQVLGMARGAVVGVLAGGNIPIYEYAPRRVKQAVCGYGNADKTQVALLVSRLLNLNIDSVPDDATDALGIALCHIQTSQTVQGLLVPDPL
jgi:crossover junction endodeoxyribonuclease RuvC